MKAYRVSVPFEFHLYIAAENEEQARRLAIAATTTPNSSMFDYLGKDDVEAMLDAVGGAFWDAHKDDPNSVVILDEDEADYTVEEGQHLLAKMLGNEKELQQAKETKCEPS